MAGRVPTVLVSSTFYDLKQVRRDLAEFIERDLGYRALIAEQGSFPIDPDATTIENCQRRVQHDTDILVLIIGHRYGFVDPTTDKSVTNLEYLTARAKGIPVYAFVERDLLTRFVVWRDTGRSPTVAGTVDSPKLFEFVERVRSLDSVWTTPFEAAQDIVMSLRAQLAYLTTEGLLLLAASRGHADEVKRLTGRAFRVALEKPPGWEYRLLGQLVVDEVEARSDLFVEHALGVALGQGDIIDESALRLWAKAQLLVLSRFSEAPDRIISKSLEVAVGAPGQPGNVREILIVAKQIGRIYEELLLWLRRVRRAIVPDDAGDLIEEMTRFVEGFAERLAAFGRGILVATDQALAAPPGASPQVVDLHISPPDMDRLRAAMARITGR